jgi:hypothetical protein
MRDSPQGKWSNFELGGYKYPRYLFQSFYLSVRWYGSGDHGPSPVHSALRPCADVCRTFENFSKPKAVLISYRKTFLLSHGHQVVPSISLFLSLTSFASDNPLSFSLCMGVYSDNTEGWTAVHKAVHTAGNCVIKYDREGLAQIQVHENSCGHNIRT